MVKTNLAFTSQIEKGTTPTVWTVRHECLDVAVAPGFEGELRNRLDAGPVVLDLAAVRFADSCGLAVLVRLNLQPGGLSCLNVHPSLARCFSRVPADKLPPVIEQMRLDHHAPPNVRLHPNHNLVESTSGADS